MICTKKNCNWNFWKIWINEASAHKNKRWNFFYFSPLIDHIAIYLHEFFQKFWSQGNRVIGTQTSLIFSWRNDFWVTFRTFDNITPKRDDRIEWKNCGTFLKYPFIIYVKKIASWSRSFCTVNFSNSHSIEVQKKCARKVGVTNI